MIQWLVKSSIYKKYLKVLLPILSFDTWCQRILISCVSIYVISIHLKISILLADTESAKASRQQLKEAICAALFDMNVPAVCALNQVAYFCGNKDITSA